MENSCIKCRKKLGNNNKSGYCKNCYLHSPQYLKYQREAQKKYSYTERRKEWVEEYRSDPKRKEYMKKYQRDYQKKNIDRLREIKRKWAEKNRGKK